MRLALLLLGSAAPLLAQPNPRRTAAALPVLEFPERGDGDTSSYGGYRTRFLRDASGNVVQIYIDARAGRIVHLWADAANASIGFTVRDRAGGAAPLTWGSPGARVSRFGVRDTASTGTRTLAWRLTTPAPAVSIGWILLGSMRVERDLQYSGAHLRPFAPFGLPELDSAAAVLERLPAAERSRHLAALGAASIDALRARLTPTLVVRASRDSTIVRVEQPAFDGKTHLALELRVASAEATASARPDGTISLRSRRGGSLAMEVVIETDAAPLTPLARDEIFTDEFLARAARARGGDSASLERRIRAVELLATREKLMAGLPNFATYFGRDMMMTALMMAPIWKPAMSEHVIASALRKLGPAGDVSHEEALGGQAIREGAAEYAALVSAWERARTSPDARARARADSLLARARAVVGDLRRTRENYHMIDDELQLPLVAARWLRDRRVPDGRKRAFLLEREPGAAASRVALLARELELVARLAMPYAGDRSPTSLLGFASLDSTRWRSSSWRDSEAGYANGRFAMDVNVVWMPLALRSIAEFLVELERLGIVRAVGGGPVTLAGADAGAAGNEPLGPLLSRFARAPAALDSVRRAWDGSARHFVVRLPAAEMRARVAARLAALPIVERRYWEGVLAATGADRDGIEFLALSLDASGRPIGVASTDVAMRMLFADPGTALPDSVARAAMLRDAATLVRPYPVGLLVDSLGPVVANDAYATPAVWERFERDRYHSPRVVWGREVNVILLALAGAIERARDSTGAPRPGIPPGYVRALLAALDRTRLAAGATGLAHAELWSYRIAGDRLTPMRFGSASDVQLWNTTSLAVDWALERVGR